MVTVRTQKQKTGWWRTTLSISVLIHVHNRRRQCCLMTIGLFDLASVSFITAWKLAQSCSSLFVARSALLVLRGAKKLDWGLHFIVHKRERSHLLRGAVMNHGNLVNKTCWLNLDYCESFCITVKIKSVYVDEEKNKRNCVDETFSAQFGSGLAHYKISLSHTL